MVVENFRCMGCGLGTSENYSKFCIRYSVWQAHVGSLNSNSVSTLCLICIIPATSALAVVCKHHTLPPHSLGTSCSFLSKDASSRPPHDLILLSVKSQLKCQYCCRSQAPPLNHPNPILQVLSSFILLIVITICNNVGCALLLWCLNKIQYTFFEKWHITIFKIWKIACHIVDGEYSFVPE